MALHEYGAAAGVDAQRQILRCGHQGATAQYGGILRDGDGVQVDDAEEGIVVVLQLSPLGHGAQRISEVKRVGGGLHTGENPAGSSSGRHDGLIFSRGHQRSLRYRWYHLNVGS